MDYLLSIDAGTTSVRAVVYDFALNVKASAQKEFRQIYPSPGFVEHDTGEIYAAVLHVIRQAAASLDAKRIAGIGITNQRETTVLFQKDGRAVHNAVVWQCRRSADICRQLRERGLEKIFSEKTGLVLDAYFSGTKIRWLLDQDPQWQATAKKGCLLFGTMDAYLAFRLTGGRSHVTDFTNASRTLLFNIHEKRWDGELLEILGIPPAMLPRAMPSASDFGVTHGVDGLPDGIPILSLIGDQQAALTGNLGFKAGDVKITYGTGCFMLMNTGVKPYASPSGLLTTLSASFDGSPLYCLEGSVFMGGAVVQWLRDGIKLLKSAPDSEAMALEARDIPGLFLVPAFTGLGCPYWDMEASGTLVGLRRETTEKEIVKAGLHGIALQVHDVYREFRKFPDIPKRTIRVDGGASRNNYLMQFQADMLDAELERALNVESTALGAAILAGSRAGAFDYQKAGGLVGKDRSFLPRLDAPSRERILSNWEKAVQAARSYKPQRR